MKKNKIKKNRNRMLLEMKVLQKDFANLGIY